MENDNHKHIDDDQILAVLSGQSVELVGKFMTIIFRLNQDSTSKDRNPYEFEFKNNLSGDVLGTGIADEANLRLIRII